MGSIYATNAKMESKSNNAHIVGIHSNLREENILWQFKLCKLCYLIAWLFLTKWMEVQLDYPFKSDFWISYDNAILTSEVSATKHTHTINETPIFRHDYIYVVQLFSAWEFGYNNTNIFFWMQRKVISLHKNLQVPRTPNTELIHNHIKQEPILKKKSNSQTSLK